MRRLVVLLAAAAAGVVAFRKVQQDKAESDLWAEATDTVR